MNTVSSCTHGCISIALSAKMVSIVSLHMSSHWRHALQIAFLRKNTNVLAVALVAGNIIERLWSVMVSDLIHCVSCATDESLCLVVQTCFSQVVHRVQLSIIVERMSQSLP